MRRFLRAIGMAEWGGDELLIATIACGSLAWALGTLLHPALAFGPLAPWLIVVYFFRNPRRQAPAGEGLIIAPADGRVSDIEELDEPAFVGGRALRVGIFLSPFDVHVNRMPCAGTVAYQQFKKGEFIAAYNPEAPQRNESHSVGIVTPDGERMLIKQVSGVLARRIVCEAEPGRAYERGELYGMIKFGSRTEWYVSVDAGYEVDVKVGDMVKGGESVLARRVGKPAASVEDVHAPEGWAASSTF